MRQETQEISKETLIQLLEDEDVVEAIKSAAFSGLKTSSTNQIVFSIIFQTTTFERGG